MLSRLPGLAGRVLWDRAVHRRTSAADALWDLRHLLPGRTEELEQPRRHHRVLFRWPVRGGGDRGGDALTLRGAPAKPL